MLSTMKVNECVTENSKIRFSPSKQETSVTEKEADSVYRFSGAVLRTDET